MKILGPVKMGKLGNNTGPHAATKRRSAGGEGWMFLLKN